MKVDKIYICATLHHVLITMIKQMHSNDLADITVCTDIPDAYGLIPRLVESGLFQNVYCFNRDLYREAFVKSRLQNLLFLHKRHIHEVEKSWKVELRRYRHIYIFNDVTALGRYMIAKHIRYHLIEDGLNAFQVLDKYTPDLDELVMHPTLRRRMIWLLGYGYRSWGQSKWCIDIEVNENKDLKIPNRKIIVKPKAELYASLSDEERRLIYHTFIREEIPCSESGTKTLLLLTQPLAQDGLVQDMQIQERVYRDIVERYGEGYQLVIKPHPRDQMKYQEIFPDAVLIDGRIPIEIINFNDSIYFDKAITIESSSIQSLQRVRKKVKLGIELLDVYNDKAQKGRDR